MQALSAGSKGVKDYNSDVKVVIHVESPQKNTLTTWSDNLEKYNVNYDILERAIIHTGMVH